MIESEILYRYDELEKAQDSADVVNKSVERFINSLITKAYEEGKKLKP